MTPERLEGLRQINTWALALWPHLHEPALLTANTELITEVERLTADIAEARSDPGARPRGAAGITHMNQAATTDHAGQCVTCEWWDADYLSDEITARGKCRRYPPREEHDSTTEEPYYGWPWCDGADWCGEWKARTR